MVFDVRGARGEGYTDAEIAEHLRAAGETPSMIGSLLRGVVKGVTFGFGDELRAGTDALAQGAGNLIHGAPTVSELVTQQTGAGSGRPTMGQAYDKSLEDSRRQDKIDAEINPVTNTTGQVVGGAAPMLLAPELGIGRLIAPVKSAVAPYVAPLVNQLASKIPAWLATTGKVAGGGAAFGGVAGFGEGEGGLGPRLESAGVGAGTGAVVAPVVQGVVSAAPAAGGRLSHAFGWRNPETAADRQIVRSLDRSGVSVDDAATKLNAAGDNPTALVDVGGRNTVNLGAVAANTPGASMEAAEKFAQSRRLGRPERIGAGVDESFGGGGGTDIADVTAQRQAQRQAEAAPLYKEAFGKPAGMTEPMQAILQDPIGQDGLKRGLEIQRIENNTRRARGEPEVPTTDPAIHYDENGDPRIVAVPNMRTLDAVKRGMDAIVEEQRDKTSGVLRLDERGRAVNDMRATWVKLLDENNPEYAAARAAWAGPSAQMEATEAGQKALATNRDIVAKRMESGSPDVQDAYRLGAGRDVTDRTSDPARAVGVARKLLEDHQMQARLESILGPEEAAKFNTVLKREADYGNVEQSVSPRAGSQTGRLTAGGADMANDVSGPLMTGIMQALTLHPIAGARTVAADWMGRRMGQGINPATADALANRLFVTDPAGRQRVTEALQNRLMQDQARTELARRFTQPVIRSLSETAGSKATRR